MKRNAAIGPAGFSPLLSGCGNLFRGARGGSGLLYIIPGGISPFSSFLTLLQKQLVVVELVCFCDQRASSSFEDSE
jgi:hypothetical protein